MECGTNVWRVLFAILSGLLSINVTVAQDTLRIIDHIGDKPENWIVRNDITGFTVPREANTLQINDDAVVSAEFSEGNRNLLVVHLNHNSSATKRADFIKNFAQQTGAKNLIALSKANTTTEAERKILFIDNQVLIAFRKKPSRQELEDFMTTYNLQLVSRPDNSEKGNVFIFSYAQSSYSDNSATASVHIYEREKHRVLFAHPNRVNLFEPQSTNDSYLDLAWHVANSGQQISCSGLSGEHQADAHVTAAWNMGYTGQGIKVGIIDFYGFDFNHPDMQGQFLSGWDCINNTAYNASNFYFTDNTQAHGMAVAGVIGAKGNNTIGSAGIAYGAKIVPFLIDGSEASVVLAMQQARHSSFDVDVVNCSFGSYFASPAIEAEIQNLASSGRVRNGAARGVVVVASHGNDNYSDVDHPQFPAGYDEVISVTSSTPDDRKKNPSDQWNTGTPWGSNYGSRLKLAAPGVCIFTTDISGSNGYSSSDYVSFQKTSASAPIVTGVVALMLSKEPNYSWQEIIDRLQKTADKVHNGEYNYNADPGKPGHSSEVGYGRVNAEKAVSDSPVGISNSFIENNSRFMIPSFVSNNLDIRYELEENNYPYEMMILDMSGKILLRLELPEGFGSINFDVTALTHGMYFVKCISGDAVVANKKFVKTR